MESSTISKLIPTDRARSQSPIKPPAPISTPVPPPATTVPKTTTTNSTTSGAGKSTPLTDLDKELQEFDIDLDKDDVSDVDFGLSTGASKHTLDEDEVTKRRGRVLLMH